MMLPTDGAGTRRARALCERFGIDPQAITGTCRACASTRISLMGVRLELGEVIDGVATSAEVIVLVACADCGSDQIQPDPMAVH